MPRGVVCRAVPWLLVWGAGCSSGPSQPPSNPMDAGAVSWTLVDLGPGRCVAINVRGQLLGTTEAGSTFLLAADGTRSELGVYEDGAQALGQALSDAGEVVGTSEAASRRTAVQFTGGRWVAVAGLSGAPWSSALGIAGDGRIVGVRGVDGDAAMRGFAIGADGERDLAVPAARGSMAFLAGAGDRVAGVVETESGDTHAFWSAGGELHDLGTLGGEASAPLGMNQRGDIVGAAETASGARHAFVARQGGALVDLGASLGDQLSEARGIDDAGHIAGNLIAGGGTLRPVVFADRGDPIDLLRGSTAYVSAAVTAMSSDGRITGWGVPLTAAATAHCLLWTPGA